MEALDEDAREVLAARVSKHYDNIELSDFKIRCGSREWNVHKFVLSVHSDVLAKCCHGNFKEAQDGILDLSKYPHDAVSKLVYYLYHFNYKAYGDDTTWLEDCLAAIDIAVIGDKYLMPGLVSLANEKIASVVDGIEDMDELAELAVQTYAVPLITQGIRKAIVKTLVEREDIIDGEPALLEAMRDYGEFATDIALEMEKKLYPVRN